MGRVRLKMATMAVAISLGCFPLFAQRGGGGGMGAGMGSGMGSNMGRGMGDSRGGPDMNRGGRMGGIDQGTRQGQAMGPKSPTEILSQNTKLSSRLGKLLPEGTNVQEAAAGFKNLGQFVAAVHVSQNLGIPFDQLKTRMTGPDSESLGKAIKSLRPDVKFKAEAKKARKQAREDIRHAEEVA
ncbi:MAG: hypothetical protein LAO07_05535 [Acidobacteriia bacterium]|nr:hypothetical protein [Terriglobia bacterium]